LDAASSVWVGLKKAENFFFVDASLFQTVKKLPVAHLAAQVLDAAEKFLAVGANSAENSGALAAINAFLTHLVLQH
jgi:hypothetical protein